MMFLILTLLISTTVSSDVVNNISKSVFASTSIPIKITRTHLNPNEDEIYKEYIYKENDKIRIDIEFGDSTITAFVYDGKAGFEEGRELPTTGSLEMVLYGCCCGYLQGMEKIIPDLYGGSEVLLVTGRAGNKLYLDYLTQLPERYVFRNKVAEFKEYKKIDGFGKIPFLIVRSGIVNGVVEIIRITEVQKQVAIPSNFFSVPRRKIETLD